MRIVDLTKDYIESILEKGDLGAYKKTHPTLFGHYFKYWADKKTFKPVLTKVQAESRGRLIIGRLNFIENKFKKFGFDVSDLKITLFVGQDTTNGHAFFDGKEFVVWLPIEAYKSKKRVDIFITHEIAHALHYSKTPDFYFGDLKRLKDIVIGSNLAVEGLATYLTKKILNISDGEALWADYVSPSQIKKWLKQCEDRQKELFKWLYDNFEEKLGDSELFGGLNTDDIFHSRGGYWAGLKIVEEIVQRYDGYNLAKILAVPQGEFSIFTKEVLRSKML